MTKGVGSLSIVLAVLLIIISSTLLASIGTYADSIALKTVKEKWIVDTGGSVLEFNWSYDSSYIAVVKENRDLMVLDSSGNIIWEETDPLILIDKAEWNPASNILAVQSNDYIEIYDIGGNLLWRSINLSSGIWGSGGFEWSPDGSKIALFTDYGNLYVYDVDGNLLWDTTDIQDVSISMIAWSPDGQRLAAKSEFVKVLLFDSEGDLLKVLSPEEDGYLKGFSWSKDGSKLVLVYSYNLYVYDNNGDLLWSYTGGSDFIGSFAWDPLGGRLAVGFSNGNIIVFDGQGQTLAEYSTIDDADGMKELVWSPSGSYIVAAVRGGSVLDVDTLVLINASTSTVVSKFSLKDWCSDIEYHSTGSLVAVGDASGTLYVFDNYLNLVYLSKTYGPPVNDLEWSPNNQFLVVGGGFSKAILYEIAQESPLIGSGEALQITNSTTSIILERNISYTGVFGTINNEWVSGYEITAYYTVREINGELPVLRIVFSFSPDILTGSVNFVFYSNGEELSSNTVAFDILHPQEGVTYYVKFLVLTDADQATLQQNMQITYQLAPGENATVETVFTPPPSSTTQEQTETTTASQEQTTTASNNLETTEEQSQETTTPAPSIETTTTELNNPLYPILRIIGQLSPQQLIMLGAIILVFLIILAKKIR